MHGIPLTNEYSLGAPMWGYSRPSAELRFVNGRLQQRWEYVSIYCKYNVDGRTESHETATPLDWRDVPSVDTEEDKED
jgi:hypothetical protein